VAHASAESKGNTAKVRSEGCASGTNLAARDAAVLEAKRNAVWLWLELEFGETPGDEFLPLLDYLDVYVASSRSVTVHAERGQTCVELDVYLFEWPLRADTAALLFRLRAEPPRVAFLFIEEDRSSNSRKFQDQTYASPLLNEAFRSRGINVIDSGTAQGAYSERELLAISESGNAALARYGVEVGADAVIAVDTKLSTRKSGAGRDAMRAQAEVRVRVVSTVDARLFHEAMGSAEIDCTAPDQGYAFALPDAVYKVQDQTIAGAIIAAHRAAGPQVRLTLQGVSDYLLAERFAKLLRSADGVSGVDVVSVRGGAALLQFAYNGRMAALVDFLQAGAQGLPRLEVNRVVGNDMHLRAVP
jgi:hypothetical protein